VELRRSINADEPIVVTEPVVMEVLAGATSERHASQLRSALLAFPLVAVAGLDDYDEAAAIQRLCRTKGETIRNTIDCLIAAVAMRVGASILHKDRDFDVIARCTDLKIQPVSHSPS
jgi:predicted nucleic acid-binding protein